MIIIFLLKRGGVCNQVYVCTNKRLTGASNSSSPEKVLFRKYGSKFVGRRGDLISVCDEAIPALTALLHHQGLGPKLYAVFEGGRLEQFIPVSE